MDIIKHKQDMTFADQVGESKPLHNNDEASTVICIINNLLPARYDNEVDE